MDIDGMKNDLSVVSQKTGAGNAVITNRMYLWFEETGILNGLRAHIRKEMKSTLRGNCARNPDEISTIPPPDIRAVNMLVADFLTNRDYLFTLSEFITEAPSLGDLHDIYTYVNLNSRDVHASSENNTTQNVPVAKPSFQLNDVQNILEALGVVPNTDVME